MNEPGPTQDQSPDHYRTIWFGFVNDDFFSKPACGCGAVFPVGAEYRLTAHLRKKLNP